MLVLVLGIKVRGLLSGLSFVFTSFRPSLMLLVSWLQS